MTDPYASLHAQVADPGPTSVGLHRLFDGSATAPAAAWHGDWNRYAAWLYSVCLRRGVQGGDARDLVQEVFSALASFRRFRHDHPGAPLRPWMVRVLMNKITDLHRDRARRPEAVHGEPLDALAEDRRLGLDFAQGGDVEHSPYAPILDRVRRRCTEPN